MCNLAYLRPVGQRQKVVRDDDPTLFANDWHPTSLFSISVACPEWRICGAREHPLHSEGAALLVPSAAVTYQDLRLLLPHFRHVGTVQLVEQLKGTPRDLSSLLCNVGVRLGRDDNSGAITLYQSSKAIG